MMRGAHASNRVGNDSSQCYAFSIGFSHCVFVQQSVEYSKAKHKGNRKTPRALVSAPRISPTLSLHRGMGR